MEVARSQRYSLGLDYGYDDQAVDDFDPDELQTQSEYAYVVANLLDYRRW